MHSIDIPLSLISIITNCFINCFNSVIINNSFSHLYPLSCGIDQGEMISPLLFLIYYNPLFKRINSIESLTHQIHVSILHNIYDTTLRDYSSSLPLVGYLDDITWTALNVPALESLLSIADDFYFFAEMKVNYLKFKILTNIKDI